MVKNRKRVRKIAIFWTRSDKLDDLERDVNRFLERDDVSIVDAYPCVEPSREAGEFGYFHLTVLFDTWVETEI